MVNRTIEYRLLLKVANANRSQHSLMEKSSLCRKPLRQRQPKEEIAVNDPSQPRKKGDRLPQLVSAFLSSASRTKEKKFWKSRTNLVQIIVDASMKMPSPPEGSLLLHESTAEILSVCRKLIKDSTESPTSDRSIDNLCVGIHGIRALVGLAENDCSLSTTCVKLLYHSIAATEAACDGAGDRSTRSKYYGLASCEALGILLSNVSMSVGGRTLVCVRGKGGAFPSLLEDKKQKKKSTRTISLPHEKIISIGSSSILAMVKFLSCNIGAEESIMRKNAELQGLHLLLYGDSQVSGGGQFLHQAVKISQEIGISWLRLLVLDVSTTDLATSFCRRLHRLLWRAAGSVVDGDGGISSLNLWVLSIHILLMWDGTARESRPLLLLRHANFEEACNLANSVSSSIHLKAQTFNTIDLADFHERVGGVFDCVAQTTASAAYYEYCAVRALHIGHLEYNDRVDRSDSIIRNLRYRCVDFNKGKEPSFDACALRAFLVLLHLMEVMEKGAKADVENPLSEVEASLLVKFREKVGQEESDASIVRWFKVFTKVPFLEKTVETLDYVDLRLYDAKSSFFETLLMMLFDCMVPLLHRTITSKKVPKAKKARLWDNIARCYMQAFRIANKVEQLLPEMDMTRTRKEASHLLRLFRNEDVRPPSLCIENTAKVRLSLNAN